MSDRIITSGNSLQFQNLSYPQIIGDFIHIIHEGEDRGQREWELDFGPVSAVFPNACTPLAGILEFLAQRRGFQLRFKNVTEYLKQTKMLSPHNVADDRAGVQAAPMSTVWRFANSADINLLTTSFVQSVSRAAVCEPGVLQALEWSINEVMDNVLQHSLVDRGYVMGQIHPSTHNIAICVFDYGQGIFHSLRVAHRLRNALDAIKLALAEGVTRDTRIGQGNGLWGLGNIVRLNAGSLTITSGPAQYAIDGGKVETDEHIPMLERDHNCTTVDFQIDYSKGIAISSALGGHEPVNDRLESVEDDRGNVVYKLKGKDCGTGTRQSGQSLRNEVLNLSRESRSTILLDFEDVAVVSSSFADEFVGKLVVEFGFSEFVQRFRLVHMNSTVAAIVNRSVSLRMGDAYRSGLQNGAEPPSEA